MPNLGVWNIDEYLTFYCNTHDPDTGVGTDADAVPAYRIYEDETGSAILNGNMAKLDDANTTGFYSERVQLTIASGFEWGKQYVIYIAATVDGDAGTMSHTFQLRPATELLDTTIDVVTSQTEFTLVEGATDDGAYEHQRIVVYDASNKEYPSTRIVGEYTGATKKVVPESAFDFTIASGDRVRIVTAGSGPSATQVADAVWDETSAGHVDAGKAGAALWGEIIPVTTDDLLTLVQGDDYNVAAAQAIEFTDAAGDWPTLTSAIIRMSVRDSSDNLVFSLSGTVVTATGDNKKVRLEPTAEDTLLLEPGEKLYEFDVRATLTTGEKVTLRRGQVTVREAQTRP